MKQLNNFGPMYNLLAEQTAALLFKTGLFLLAWYNWVMAQVATPPEEVFNQVFEFSMSLGILIAVLVWMFYENKSKEKQRSQAQDDMVSLLKTNIKAIQDFTQTNKDVVKSIERGQEAQAEAMDNLTKAFEKLEHKL